MQHGGSLDSRGYNEEQWVKHFWISTKIEHLEMVTYAVKKAYPFESRRQLAREPSSFQVADILRSIQVDQITLIAALMSDQDIDLKSTESTPLDNLTLQLINNVYVMDQLQGCTKKNKEGELKNTEPQQAELVRRMLLALTDDVRAVLIFLAWKLARLRLLSHLKANLQRCLADEALNIFAPLANRLGINQLKWEMEDLSFRYLTPSCYKQIAQALNHRRVEREEYIQKITARLEDLMQSENIQARVYGRPKHIYSIYKKMTRKGLDSIDELYDIQAIRIIVNSEADCYTVLGIIHLHWRNVPKEFDDYISQCKANGYQSLHTVIYGPANKYVEIQIRTEDMHLMAEMGVAAHWRYKEEGINNHSMQQAVSSIRALLDQDESDSQLLENFKTELFSDRVFVFTPTGQIHDLSRGATPLDFAYAVHTELGHCCIGAKVNGRIVPLTYPLSNGDKVQILKGNKANPKSEWLGSIPPIYVRTVKAKTSIRYWLRQQNEEKHLADGKIILERELKRCHIKQSNMASLCERLHVDNKKALYRALGRGDINMKQLNNALHEKQDGHEFQPLLSNRISRPNSELLVEGESGLMINIANCCKPVPGDSIIGYITLGRGVTVHRVTCANIQLCNLMPDQHSRITNVSWGKVDSYYSVDLFIIGYNQPGLLRDIADVIALANTNIQKIESSLHDDKHSSRIKLTVQLHNKDDLNLLIRKLQGLPNVIEVNRHE